MRQGFSGVPPYVEWPPVVRKRKRLETVECPHCAREFELEPFRPGMRSSSEACDKAREATHGAVQESFLVLFLNARNRIIGKREVCRGTATACVVHPRDVFREAITKNAAAVIVAHNHPSGDPRPSEEDAVLTQRLIQAGKFVGIPLLDHVVTSKTGCYSLRDAGVISFAGRRRRRR